MKHRIKTIAGQLGRVHIIGLTILFVAVGANYLAVQLGLHTWYDVVTIYAKGGFLAVLRETSILSGLFLVVIYPLVLGLTVEWISFFLQALAMRKKNKPPSSL